MKRPRLLVVSTSTISGLEGEKMTRACKQKLKAMADNWIDRVELGGDSVSVVNRDKRSLLALLVKVYQHEQAEEIGG